MFDQPTTSNPNSQPQKNQSKVSAAPQSLPSANASGQLSSEQVGTAGIPKPPNVEDIFSKTDKTNPQVDKPLQPGQASQMPVTNQPAGGFNGGSFFQNKIVIGIGIAIVVIILI